MKGDLGSIQEDVAANKQESSPPSISNSTARRVSNVGGPIKFCLRMREGGRWKVHGVKFFPRDFSVRVGIMNMRSMSGVSRKFSYWCEYMCA